MTPRLSASGDNCDDHVVSAAQLEAADRLLALRLDVEIEVRLRKAAHPQPRPLHAIQRCPHRNPCDPFLRRSYLFQVSQIRSSISSISSLQSCITKAKKCTILH